MKTKIKPAFPGRASSLGYEPGLTKLEWIVTQLVTAELSKENVSLELEIIIENAKQIIKACEAAESKN